MNFLYIDNGRGAFSSITNSAIIWIILILVIVLIVVIFFVKQQAPAAKDPTAQQYSGDVFEMNEIHEGIANEINYQNSLNRRTNDDIEEEEEKLNNQEETKFAAYETKWLDSDIEIGDETKINLLGLDQPDKNIKTFYPVSSKNSIFKIINEKSTDLKFKIELKDLSKLNPNDTNFLKIYNQDCKCIAIVRLDNGPKLKIQTNSPFFDDIYIDFDPHVKYMIFIKDSEKLFLDATQIGAFDIYDKITYFYIKSSLIKEIQYL